MSELAFNANGDNFEIPAIVTGWRVRRLKPRGAPELVYGRDGRPLTVPIESSMDDLRDAVGGVLARYRLDPVNDDGKIIETVPAAYIQVVKSERPVETAVGLTHRDEGDSVLREAMRLNTELAKSVIDRFPEMMQAAAELLRAADGAGLPARQPRVVDEEDNDDEEDEAVAVASPGFELINNLVAQVIPIVVTSLAGKKMPKLDAILDWRKASPQPASSTEPQPTTKAKGDDAELPPLDPKMMSHFIAIQSALAPDEAVVARQLASELSPGELRSWFNELSALSVPDAVTKIRSLIGNVSNGVAS